ncbi:MAG: hypothetical protein LBR68_02390 [Lachnoclostridium sp.]|nr:hypothetical protein [Lachnoclostridium sp.]
MLDRKQLEAMNNVDITTIDRHTLVDMNKISINDRLDSVQKMENYIEQVKNPYCFLCGSTPVKIRFATDTKTLAQSLGNYFSSLK